MPEGGNIPPEDRQSNIDSDSHLLDRMNALIARLEALHGDFTAVKVALEANARERA